MSVLQKLKDLKRVLDRNLATKSQDILPVINAVIIELETPVMIESVNQIKQDKPPKIIKAKEDDKNEETDTVERAKEYLKSIKAKGIHFYKDNDKLIVRAVKDGFII